MSFIHNPLYIFAILAFVLLLSDWLVRKTFFKSFGIALLVIIITAILANARMLPTTTNVMYEGIFTYIAPGALFLLLLDVNLKQLKKVGFPILLLFLMGSLGTVLGVVVASLVIPDQPYFDGMYSAIAGMFAGTYTGGGINFNAVALHYKVVEKSVVYTNAVAVDNVMTTLWFFVTVALPVALQKMVPRSRSKNETERLSEVAAASDEIDTLSLKTLSIFLGLSSLFLFISEEITALLTSYGVIVPAILILTTFALLLAQIPAISKLKGNMLLGSWAVYLFLAVIGAFCDFHALGKSGDLSLYLLLFVTIVVLVHGLFIFGSNFFTKLDWQLVAIASQANIGGGTSAMALAKNFKRNELILPAIIIGSIGNALGTYIGFLVAGYI